MSDQETPHVSESVDAVSETDTASDPIERSPSAADLLPVGDADVTAADGPTETDLVQSDPVHPSDAAASLPSGDGAPTESDDEPAADDDESGADVAAADDDTTDDTTDDTFESLRILTLPPGPITRWGVALKNSSGRSA
jgi:hypothetical protein